MVNPKVMDAGMSNGTYTGNQGGSNIREAYLINIELRLMALKEKVYICVSKTRLKEKMPTISNFFGIVIKIENTMFTEVIQADYIGEYKLSIQFNDGINKIVDFYSMLFERDYSAFRPLKDIDVFRQFKVTDTIEWKNGEIDLAPETIFEM